MIGLRYTLLSTWPPLAWLARCPKGESFIDVYHGSRVEVTDEFFGELYGLASMMPEDLISSRHCGRQWWKMPRLRYCICLFRVYCGPPSFLGDSGCCLGF